MRTGLIRALAMASAVLAVWPAWAPRAQAHHSFAIFDRSRQVSLSGAVKQFDWTNPHCRLEVAVVNKTGREETWILTALSPNLLERHGWKRNTLKTGDKVTVLVYPLRDGKAGGNLISVTLPDGRVFGGGGGG